MASISISITSAERFILQSLQFKSDIAAKDLCPYFCLDENQICFLSVVKLSRERLCYLICLKQLESESPRIMEESITP